MATRKHSDRSREQLALAKARKEKQINNVMTKDNVSQLLSRRWLSLPLAPNLEHPEKYHHQVKIMTWNLLAQCLIKRELFPTSDCLKASQREPMIHEEILQHDADIICLQEVDRLDKLVPMLENAGYDHRYGSGPGKKHGCMIAFKKTLFSMVSDKVVYYDQCIPMDNDSGRSLTRNTIKTRNIGLLVALKSLKQEAGGLIVATTHLFWHPKYTYERTRQTAILLEEVVAFQTNQKAQKWPCILAGDFNFTPSDPAYTLIVGDTLLPDQEAMILSSLVIHSSVDPSVNANTPASNAASEEDSEHDPDRVITNARQAESRDELLTISQFITWFSSLPNLRSAYNEGLQAVSKLSDPLPTYGRRVTLPLGRRGSHEPEYTSYTHFWQSVLDLKEPMNILGLLESHGGKILNPGLPKKNISGSDHISLVVEVGWQSELNEQPSQLLDRKTVASE